MCHAMVMSWILAPGQPGPPPSLPQGYTLSLHLTFQINLLYCILCLVDLLSASFQFCELWSCICTSFKRFFKFKGQRMSNSACDQSIIGGQSVTCRTFSRFPPLHLRGAQHYFLLAILQSCNPPHFSTIGGSLFWRLEFTKYQNSTPHNMRHSLITCSLRQVLSLPCGSWGHHRSWELPQQACRSPRRHRSSPSGLPRLEPSSLLQSQQPH